MDLASSLAICGWFIQVIFDKLLSATMSSWRSSWRSDADLPGALKRLENTMKKVRTVLSLTQNIRSENEGLLDWLKDLKDAAYDVDDLLDELDYRRLQQQAAEGDDDNGDSKVSEYLYNQFNSAMAFVGKNINETDGFSLAGCDRPTVYRINDIVEGLDGITSGLRSVLKLLKLEDLGPKQQHGCILNDYRVTTSLLLSEHTVVGRDKERDEIIELLLNRTANEAKVSVLPIVGLGGVGKTTLARLVYNNKRVKEYFDHMVWVCVSNNFDVVLLTREMLEGLDVRGYEHLTNPNKLQEVLKENLSSHRFLLVLDDVWNDKEMTKWETFCAPLGSGKPGSRILMTTRLNTVVQMVGGKMDTMSSMELKGLPHDKYWSLFQHCTFGGKDPHQHDPELEFIGRQILEKLSGSPLAAKTVGGLLRERMDVDHWRSILECNIWELRQNLDDIMPVLRLSYQHLPPHLQQCFSYCSVFPKDYRFKQDMLVAMWIAQGYVQDKTRGGKKRLMDIGKEYFHNLQRMYFFEEYNQYQFVIHDLLHDLSEYVSAGECFRVEGDIRKGIPRNVRHLFVYPDMIMEVLKQSYNLTNLRTLIIEGDFINHMATIEDLFTELRRLRVLRVDPSYFISLAVPYFPHKIGHMIHLRYLEVPQYYKLPSSLSELYHLQFLKAQYHLERSHLVIKKLTCLQELDPFYVSKEEGHDTGQLKNLGELGGSLKLYDLDNVASKTEALEAQLNQKKHIRLLQLHWNYTSDTLIKVAEEVLEGLQPPPNIELLVIWGYPGVKFPTWKTRSPFNLPALSTLKIIGCPRITSLPSTEVLHQPLKRLKIKYCPELMSIEGLQAFVSLDTLTIIRCPKLIPKTCLGIQQDHAKAFTLRLCNLTIDDPAILTMLLKNRSLPYLQFIEIKFCSITSFNMEEEIFSHLTSLTSLKINSCRNLQFLPAYLKSLHSLKELIVVDCGKLQSLPLMPASLSRLCVRGCYAMPKERYKEGGEDWHNIAHVPNISWG